MAITPCNNYIFIIRQAAMSRQRECSEAFSTEGTIFLPFVFSEFFFCLGAHMAL